MWLALAVFVLGIPLIWFGLWFLVWLLIRSSEFGPIGRMTDSYITREVAKVGEKVPPWDSEDYMYGEEVKGSSASSQ